MKLWLLVLPCALLAQEGVAACRFDTNLVPYQGGAAALSDDPALPIPEVERVNVTRGAGGGAACDLLGFVSVGLRWPKGSRFDLDQLGFQYELLEGDAPTGLVPAGVVVAPGVSGRKVEHVLAWQDEDLVRAQRLDLKLAVRAVTPDGRRSAPLVVAVYASPGL